MTWNGEHVLSLRSRESGIQACLCWVLLAKVLWQAAVEVLAEALMGEGLFSSSLTQLLAEFSILQAVRLGAWVPPWVLACGPSLVLYHTGFTVRQLTMWPVTSIRVGKWENKTGWARRKPETFCKLISQMTPYPFYSLEAIHLVQLILKGRGLYTGMNPGR